MDYYIEIKKELIDNDINKKLKDYSKNKYELQKYYNVGKLLNEAGHHYGESVIKDYSKKLTNELNRKYDISSLNKMRKFYNLIEKMVTVSPLLSYSHYVELLPYKNLNKINYYIKITIENNLSVRKLRDRIKSNEYERLPEKTKNRITIEKYTNIIDYVKDPILIKNSYNYDNVSEKVLQKLILDDISSFLDELGNGFTFIRNEYQIKLGNNFNYIDLLLYNIKYKCYVVCELKVTELKKEHIGQIEIYMNYIDENIKTIEENRTVGIIICRQDNKYIIKYCSDNRIISRIYKLK